MTGRRGATLDHVAIETADIDADVAILTRTVGLTEVRWGVHVVNGGRIAMLTDHHGMKVELIETATPDGTLAHLAFEVPDVAVAAASAIEAGCLGEIDLIRIPAAMASISQVRSPAGTALQLIHYEPGSPDITRPPAARNEAGSSSHHGASGAEGSTS
ncbi:hypothetical protein BH09ACT12_BH09ACT12_30350 [soil metagenome]